MRVFLNHGFIRVLNRPRQRKEKRRARSHFALQPHIPAVRLDNVLDDGQPKASPARLARAGAIHSVGARKNTGPRFGRNAPAVLLRPNVDTLLAHGPSTHVDLGVSAPVFNGVLHKIEKDLVQAFRIGARRQPFWNEILNRDFASLGAGLQSVNDPRSLVAQLDLLQVQNNPSAFQARDGQQIFNQIGETVSVLLDGVQKAGRQRRVVLCALEKRFDKTLNQRKRRAQFMADVGEKFLARVLQLSQARQIVKHENRSLLRPMGVKHRGRADLDPSLVHARQLDFRTAYRTLAPEALGDGGQFLQAKGLENRLAPHIIRKPAEPLQGLIDQLDAARAVQNEHALGHAVEEDLLLGLFFGQGLFVLLLLAHEDVVAPCQGGLQFSKAALPPTVHGQDPRQQQRYQQVAERGHPSTKR